MKRSNKEMDRESRPTPRPARRRRKRGARLVLAYALQALLAALAIIAAAIFVCGILYIREHLFAPADEAAPQPPPAAPEGDEDPEEPVPQPAGGQETQYTVVLDAGHGGYDPGCESGGATEKDITLAIALLAAEKLRAAGVTVILTRDGDSDVSLDERCRIANDTGADLFVSIHCNSYTDDESVSGLEGYYHNGTKGQRLAQLILDAAGEASVKTRSVKDANYQVLRDTAMPSALIEVGFLTNPSERAMLQTPDYQETLAQAVVEGISRMLEI